MEEFTGAVFNDSMHNYRRAGDDLAQTGMGLWHAVEGLWEAGTGLVGTVGRTIGGTAELAAAGITFLPELVIDGAGMAIDGAIDAAVASRVAPECRVDSADRADARSVGQTVGAAAARAAERSSDSYTVQAGDSLWKIAADRYRDAHGGQVDNRAVLATVQELKSRYGEVIHPGMEISFRRDRQGA